VRLVLSVLAATLVVAASTGCSSDDDSGTDAAGTTTAAVTTAPPIETRPEPPADQSRWAKQVDQACKPWQERIEALPPPTDESTLEQWLAQTLPLIRKQVAAVRAVKLPAKQSEASQAALFVGGMQRVERSLTRYLAAIRAGDAEAIQQALTDANAAGVETRGYAVSLDITECGGYEGGG
jgi:hypothetical protein